MNHISGHNYQQQQNLNNIGGCAARKSRFSAPVVNCGVSLAAAADKTSPNNNNKQPIIATKRKDVIEQMATLGVRRELEGDAQGITALELVGGGGVTAPTSSCNSNNNNNTTNKEEDEDLEEFFFGPK